MAGSYLELQDDTRSDWSEINNYDGVQYYDDCRFMSYDTQLQPSSE